MDKNNSDDSARENSENSGNSRNYGGSSGNANESLTILSLATRFRASSLNKMISYKIEAKGGLLLVLNTKKLKPSQRCPNCGKVHKHWADLSNRYHVCDSCGFEIERDKGSALVMYKTALSRQSGDGIALVDVDVRSSTSKTRKNTGSFKQLQQAKRSKLSKSSEVMVLETPSSYEAG
ncbi:MAG: zinc ribbon domain-containing protein [Rivularia sp. (in: cyanobacteria)]